jgi:hypothetical protein
VKPDEKKHVNFFRSGNGSKSNVVRAETNNKITSDARVRNENSVAKTGNKTSDAKTGNKTSDAKTGNKTNDAKTKDKTSVDFLPAFHSCTLL